jgi:hypothetical protein
MVSDWNCLKYFCVFFLTVIIRCTETFWSPCTHTHTHTHRGVCAVWQQGVTGEQFQGPCRKYWRRLQRVSASDLQSCSSPQHNCTAEFVWRSPSSFVPLLNHFITTQHVPWKPSWSVRFGSTNTVNRPHCLYIRDGSFGCVTYCQTPFTLGRQNCMSQNGPRLTGVGRPSARPPGEAMVQVPRYQLHYIGKLNNPVQGESVLWIRYAGYGVC